MCPDGRPARVLLVAQRRLVGQAIAAALRAKGLVPTLLPWPQRGALREFRRQVALSKSMVGIILCDLGTPDLLRDVEVMVSRSPLRWIVLTDSDMGPRWGTVLEAGATGILPTTTNTTGLIDAVAATFAGRSPTPPVVRDQALREWHDVAAAQRDLVRRMERLTHREFEILGYLYDGVSVKRIADATGVAESTVRTQVKSLRRKLDVDSQLAAVAVYRKALAIFPRARA